MSKKLESDPAFNPYLSNTQTYRLTDPLDEALRKKNMLREELLDSEALTLIRKQNYQREKIRLDAQMYEEQMEMKRRLDYKYKYNTSIYRNLFDSEKPETFNARGEVGRGNGKSIFIKTPMQFEPRLSKPVS